MKKVADKDHIHTAIAIAKTDIQEIQHEAAHKLLSAVGEHYPHDGCAITLSCLLQEAGIDVADIYQAFELGKVLKERGWKVVPVGKQQAGDVGSTCGSAPSHGDDHIYFVMAALNPAENIIADNQSAKPHFRFTSGHGKTRTRFFLRAP